MATNTLSDRASGETITASFFNDLNSAVKTELVGRNSAGVPASGQSLGTVAFPWGTVYTNGIVLGGSAVDTSQLTSQPNRVVSGAKRTTSNQPAFIVPANSSPSFTIDGTPTNLVLDINGIAVTVTTDIVKGSLTPAPATNNTALVNDTDAADQHDTRLWGEPCHRKKITIDTVGSNITALVGKYASFKIFNGTDTEYFYAFVESATSLSDVRRGYFYDSSLNPVKRIVFSNNDTITLMNTAWIFIENNATTVDVTYNNPVWAFTAPTSPATGDYWYDLQNQTWKRYDGATFQIINRTFVGMAILDSTNCIAARCSDFWKNQRQENTFVLERVSTEVVRVRDIGAKVFVNGVLLDYGFSRPSWNITTDLAGSADMYDASEQSSRIYYLYIKDDGRQIISDITPYIRNDLQGRYHPHNPWRCVGYFYNDAGGDIQAVGSWVGGSGFSQWNTPNGYGSTLTRIRRYSTLGEAENAGVVTVDSGTDGNFFTVLVDGLYRVNRSDRHGAAGFIASITFNSDPTVDGSSYQNADNQILNGSTNQIVTEAYVVPLKVGDVVRAHDDSGSQPNDTSGQCRFGMRQLPSSELGITAIV